MREQMVNVGLWLDNSALTPKQTVKAIVDRADEAVISSVNV